MKPGTSSVDTLYLRVFSLVTNDMRSGMRMSLTNIMPVFSSIEMPPQFMPPNSPGHSMYGFSVGGVNGPTYTESLNMMRQ
ncbi:hypothetical protein D3C80_1157600 [compost metagenome]